jgi:dTDP-glucose 4,6-dehydratase
VNLVSQADVIVHAAAESHVERALIDPKPFLRSNVHGTLTLLEAACEAGVPRFFHISTDEVFGEALDGRSFLPGDPLRPGNFYAATKASAEAFVHYMRHTRRYPVGIVRCTNNYGPRQHPEKAIPRWILSALTGRPLFLHGGGRAERNWIHVEDFAAGMGALLASGITGGEHHFRGELSLPNREVVETLRRLAGTKAPLVDVEDRPGQDARYDIDDTSTRARLGWAPRIPFAQGLASTLAWYREQLRADAAPWFLAAGRIEP